MCPLFRPSSLHPRGPPRRMKPEQCFVLLIATRGLRDLRAARDTGNTLTLVRIHHPQHKRFLWELRLSPSPHPNPIPGKVAKYKQRREKEDRRRQATRTQHPQAQCHAGMRERIPGVL